MAMRKSTRSARKSTRSARKSTRKVGRKSTRSARKTTHKGGSGTTHYKSSQRQNVEHMELSKMPQTRQKINQLYNKSNNGEGGFQLTHKGGAAPVPLCYSTGVRGGRICNS